MLDREIKHALFNWYRIYIESNNAQIIFYEIRNWLTVSLLAMGRNLLKKNVSSYTYAVATGSYSMIFTRKKLYCVKVLQRWQPHCFCLYATDF